MVDGINVGHEVVHNRRGIHNSYFPPSLVSTESNKGISGGSPKVIIMPSSINKLRLIDKKARSVSSSSSSSEDEDEDGDGDATKQSGNNRSCLAPLAPGEQEEYGGNNGSLGSEASYGFRKHGESEAINSTFKGTSENESAVEHIRSISSEPDLPHSTLPSSNIVGDNEMHHSVSWGTITIIEHARELGDNPACGSGGPPITLGWKPIHPIRTLDLDIYEDKRPCRRKQEEMMVPPLQREEWLRSEGYGTRQIYDTIRQVRRAREERGETVNRLRYHRIEEFRESCRRKFARLRAKLRR